MHASCQFVPQAVWRAEGALFSGAVTLQNFSATPNGGESGLTTLVAATRPARTKTRLSHGEKPVLTSLVTSSPAW